MPVVRCVPTRRVEVTKSWRSEYDKQLANFSIVVGLTPCISADNPLVGLGRTGAQQCPLLVGSGVRGLGAR